MTSTTKIFVGILTTLLIHWTANAELSKKCVDLIEASDAVASETKWTNMTLQSLQNRVEITLGRKVSHKELIGVDMAHQIGSGELGVGGEPAGIGTYTRQQLLWKAKLLGQVGFTVAEVRKLVEKGIVGKPSAFIEIGLKFLMGRGGSIDLVLQHRILELLSTGRYDDIEVYTHRVRGSVSQSSIQVRIIGPRNSAEQFSEELQR